MRWAWAQSAGIQCTFGKIGLLEYTWHTHTHTHTHTHAHKHTHTHTHTHTHLAEVPSVAHPPSVPHSVPHHAHWYCDHGSDQVQTPHQIQMNGPCNGLVYAASSCMCACTCVRMYVDAHMYLYADAQVYAPHNLGICIISRLCCTFQESRNCVPISRLCTTNQVDGCITIWGYVTPTVIIHVYIIFGTCTAQLSGNVNKCPWVVTLKLGDKLSIM